MESTACGAASWQDDGDWELAYDEGFIFKSRKRHRVDPDADPTVPAPSAADLQADAEKLRKGRRKKSLLKLKARYQSEIDHWELLSSTLRAVEERTRQLQEQRPEEQEREQTAPFRGSVCSGIQGAESACGSLVDELLLQAEAQEAIIRDVSNLCDTAEAMCNEQEGQIAQSLIDLPIWGSPRELMRSLCDP